MNLDYKKIYPHAIAVLIFLVLSLIFLSPVFQGLVLKQEDIGRHKGVAKEIYDHRKEYEEEPLWTNSMFGGMPATQVSVVHDSNLMMYVDKVMTLWLPHPVSYMFLYILGFYILCICLSIRPWLSIVGALMFGLSSFFFISIAAGHNSKVMAMAYMPMIIGAFIYTIRNKAFIGAILFAFFLALELRSNHVQITYYAFMIIFSIGIYELFKFYKEKQLITFFKRVGLLIIAGIFAVACNYGNLFMTYDYLPDSQRGPSELSLESNSENSQNKTEGLNLDYMTNWSYGIGESLNMIIPNAKGGGSGPYIIEQEVMDNDKVSNEFKKGINNYSQMGWQVSKYWGNQPFTSGPVYLGASIFFLFLLGLVFLEDKLKWALLIVAIISLLLSWGHNFIGFTEFFVDFIPGYSKFRSVTMILVIVELVVPMVAIMWLFQFISKGSDKLRSNENRIVIGRSVSMMKLFFIVSGLFALFLLLMAIAPDKFLNFTNTQENQILSQIDPSNTFKNELIDFRLSIMSSDAVRSLLLVLALFVVIYLFIKKKLKQNVFIVIVCLVTLFDLWQVSKRYLHNKEYTAFEKQMMRANGLKYWEDKELKLFPNQAQAADLAILEEEKKNDNDLKSEIDNHSREIYKEFEGNQHIKRIVDSESFSILNFNSNYRVLELGNRASDPINNARTSFFHKSIGGYSAVKVRRVQDVLDYLYKNQWDIIDNGIKTNSLEAFGSSNIFNMLNTKYYIINLARTGVIDLEKKQFPENAGVFKNPNALGNAWSVNKIIWVNGPNDEFTKLSDVTFDPSISVIIDEKYKNGLKEFNPKGKAIIKMTGYKANHISYECNSEEDDFVVFSEIFYDKGWKAYIDGKEVKHVRVNYILRGLKVPSGKHKIEFKFDLPIYHTASLISLVSSSILILLFGLILFMKFRGKSFPEI